MIEEKNKRAGGNDVTEIKAGSYFLFSKNVLSRVIFESENFRQVFSTNPSDFKTIYSELNLCVGGLVSDQFLVTLRVTSALKKPL